MQQHRFVRRVLCMRIPRGCSQLSNGAFNRPFSTSKRDGSAKGHDKFGWMDEAIEKFEVREASGLIDFSEENAREFEEKGFITESEEVVKKVEEMEANGSSRIERFISEDFVKEMFECESEDLLEILGIENETADAPADARQRLLHEALESKIDDSWVQAVEKVSDARGLEEAEDKVPAQGDAGTEFQERVEKGWVDSSNGPHGLQALLESDVASSKAIGALSQLSIGRLPMRTKKPGYEKRVLQMESEMSRIVEHTLALRYPEWDSFGAGIVEVVLSPNMRNLTIYYEVAEEKRNDKGWPKMLKRISKGVRAEIAKLDIRYAPQVHFQGGRTQEPQRHANLDDIFSQIAKEREIAGVRRSG